MKTKHYQNDDIIVTWEPAKCIHSAICFKGLSSVFNPNKRPWITMEGASTNAIIDQVKQCPSGAISYVNKEEKKDDGNLASDNSTILKIKVTAGGPLLIEGAFMMEKNNEQTKVDAKVTALCRCGLSKNKPFCDGSHRTTDFDK